MPAGSFACFGRKTPAADPALPQSLSISPPSPNRSLDLRLVPAEHVVCTAGDPHIRPALNTTGDLHRASRRAQPRSGSTPRATRHPPHLRRHFVLLIPRLRRRTRLLLAFLLAVTIAVPVLGTAATHATAASSAPCDIYASGGTPCAAAYSTTRAMFSSYNGPLYEIQRASDGGTPRTGHRLPRVVPAHPPRRTHGDRHRGRQHRPAHAPAPGHRPRADPRVRPAAVLLGARHGQHRVGPPQGGRGLQGDLHARVAHGVAGAGTDGHPQRVRAGRGRPGAARPAAEARAGGRPDGAGAGEDRPAPYRGGPGDPPVRAVRCARRAF